MSPRTPSHSDPTSRRAFLGMAGAALLPAPARAAAEAVRGMKIVKIDAVTFRRDLRIQGISPNWTWVRLYTDSGLVGIGESYPTQQAHIGALKELAPMILGKDPTAIERLWQDDLAAFLAMRAKYLMY